MTMTSAATPDSADLTVVCRLHNRRVMVHTTEGSPPRIRHMSRVDTPAEFCDAIRFTVRREFLVEDRDAVLAELTAEQERQR
jgi:hypothetical protein